MAAADVEFWCFVGGLAWATDNEALEKAFSAYGEIVESKVRSFFIFDSKAKIDQFLFVINDREIERSRGFRFVTFASEQAMRNAIDDMNGSSLDVRNITVNEARNITVNETQFREGGGGGFRSGGGGGYGGGGFSHQGGGGGYRSGTVMKVDTTETMVTAVVTEKKCEKKRKMEKKKEDKDIYVLATSTSIL
ncbi:Glycine-rich RNA-binding, abscisic acid-inducible protein [Arachis hypogaea]|nr:Glycine-rich RNA-binding, abscisic acid-inducible protein [Arachis hypogaea]